MNEAARIVVDALRLAPHPEGGFYRETHRATALVPTARGERSASTAIYFLLPGGDVSALHRVRSDEVWHHYAGDPVEVHTVTEAGVHAVEVLGSDVTVGQRPQFVVPAGVWQAAVTRGSGFALCGCTVAPGFDFADFEMPSRTALLAKYPALQGVLERVTRAEAG